MNDALKKVYEKIGGLPRYSVVQQQVCKLRYVLCLLIGRICVAVTHLRAFLHKQLFDLHKKTFICNIPYTHAQIFRYESQLSQIEWDSWQFFVYGNLWLASQ